MDESGSMNSVQHDIINSLNHLVAEQRDIKDKPASLSLLKFNSNHNIRYVYQNSPIETIGPMTISDYSPNGNTALYDAIGRVLDDFSSVKNVLLVIVTDGQENDSHTYSQQTISSRLDTYKNTLGWSFVYISSDQSTSKQGYGLGFNDSSFSCNMVPKCGTRGFSSQLHSVSNALSANRAEGANVQSFLRSHAV